jgi:L-fucose isomerase-like protein
VSNRIPSISETESLSSLPSQKVKDVSLNELVAQINDGKVASITVEQNMLDIALQDKTKERASKESEASLSETLTNYGVVTEKLNAVNITVKEPSGFAFWAATPLGVVGIGLGAAFFSVIACGV